MLCPVSMTPFGLPVVPPVPAMIATSPAGPACQGSPGSPLSQLLNEIAPGMGGVAGSGPAMGGVAGSEPAMGGVAGSELAMGGVAGSEPALSWSRQTSVASFGRSAAIWATSGANAAWKIRQEQSKASRSSRFSVASLRGLTGHHTAPARAMPTTQENATGSFAESTATLSPGRTPDRDRARAIDQDSLCTSR